MLQVFVQDLGLQFFKKSRALVIAQRRRLVKMRHIVFQVHDTLEVVRAEFLDCRQTLEQGFLSVLDMLRILLGKRLGQRRRSHFVGVDRLNDLIGLCLPE